MLNIESHRIFLEALADREGISIVFDEECRVPTASATGVITLPPPTPATAEEWLYLAHHEISHLFPENLWTYKYLKLVKSEFEAMVANCIVDYIAEKSKWGYYSGRDAIMDKGVMNAINKVVSSLPGGERKPELNLLCAMIMMDLEGRKEWPHTPNIKAVDISWHTTEPIIKDFYDKLKALHMTSRVNDCNTVVKLHELVQDILKLIDQESSVSEQQASDADSGKEAEGKAEDSEGKAKSNSQDKAEGNSEDGKAKDKLSQGSTNEGIPDSMKPKPLEFEEGKSAPSKQATYGSRKYVPYAHNKIINLSLGRTSNEGRYASTIRNEFLSSTLTKQIRKHLMAISQSRYEGGKRRGKLSVSSISKLYTSDRPTMFKQKVGTQIKADTTVSLLIDFSGSMSGSKYTTASASAISVANILTTLRIKHEILGFSEGGRGIVSYVVKPYDEGMGVSDEELVQRFSDRRIRLNGNCDGESLTWCAGRLIDKPEKNKVMMVFSDGYPCGGYSGDGTQYLKDICKEIEQKSPIYLTGIGIESDSVAEFYANSSVINSISELNKAVLGTLQNNILRG